MFIETYLEYAARRTDAPPQFHQTVILTILGWILGRQAVHPLRPSEIYHNLFSWLIGDSRRTRKSTSINLALDVFVIPLYKGRGSYEALFDHLVTQPNLIIHIDEGEEFLQLVTGKGSYARKMLPFLSTLYGCPNLETRITKKGGHQYIQDPFVSMLLGITTRSFEECVGASFLEQGFFNRLFICFGSPQPVKKRTYIDDEDITLRRELYRLWNDLLIYSQETSLEFRFTAGVLELYHQLTEQLDQLDMPEVEGLKEETKTFLVKIADILAFNRFFGAGRAPKKKKETSLTPPPFPPTTSTFTIRPQYTQPVGGKSGTVEHIAVTQADLDQAYQIVLARLKDANRLYSHLRESENLSRALKLLETYKKMTRANFLRRFKKPVREFDETIDTLIERGQVRVIDFLILQQGGEPVRRSKSTWEYVYVGDEEMKEEWERSRKKEGGLIDAMIQGKFSVHRKDPDEDG